jgi:hypothetical protein
VGRRALVVSRFAARDGTHGATEIRLWRWQSLQHGSAAASFRRFGFLIGAGQKFCISLPQSWLGSAAVVGFRQEILNVPGMNAKTDSDRSIPGTGQLLLLLRGELR